jgi:tetratricopeptide (TPR) repeat protein
MPAHESEEISAHTRLIQPVCFMVMPFGTKSVLPKPDAAPEMIDFDALWNKALAPVIDELGYEPVRADQDTGASIILEMLERLYFSDLVVADMTIPNGNVYYEIGIRHACKPTGCLLISADWAQPLFDTNQMRRLVYPLADGSVSDEAAEKIKAALRTGSTALADGLSPMYQHICGFPDPSKIDPNRASVIRAQLDALSAFQARVRAVRLTRTLAQRAEGARGLRDDDPANSAIPQGVALEVAMLLRDCADWQDCIAYIDALPASMRELGSLQEQRCLALSKTGNHEEAIGALMELIARSGDSAERQGLIGGRYKKLASKARESGDATAYANYIDQAICHYEQGMLLDLNNYYPSSNLPRLYRERGDEGDAERAGVAAQVAMMACERARARNAQDEWLNPTLLGLAFDAGDVAAAKRCVKLVRRDGPAAWKLETTLDDLDRSVAQATNAATQQALAAMVEELKALLNPATPA